MAVDVLSDRRAAKRPGVTIRRAECDILLSSALSPYSHKFMMPPALMGSTCNTWVGLAENCASATGAPLPGGGTEKSFWILLRD